MIVNISNIFTPKDIFSLLILFLFVLLVLFIAEILKRKDIIEGQVTRKIVHLSVGNVVIGFPFMFTNVWTALIGPTFFIFFTYFTCPGSPIKQFRLKSIENGHTYGTVYYALALTILTAIFFNAAPLDQHNVILICSFLPLVWGDGVSAVVGSKFGHDKAYTIFGGTKSLLGSWAAAFSTFGSVSIACLILQRTLAVSIYLGLLTGFLTAVIEAITPKGFDNLAVPAGNALVLFGLHSLFDGDLANLNEFLSLYAIIAGLAIGLILAILGIIFKALTWDGAIAGFYFGVLILGLGSWSWGAMYITFFVVGSFFTFVGKTKKKKITEEYEKGDTARDSVQAMVNSFIPAILALLGVLIRDPIITIMTAGALATSLADTLGTEIGAMSKEKPRLALKPWTIVEKGSPGGVSLVGLAASFLGATLIGFVGWIVSFIDTYSLLPEKSWIIIVIGGIGGFIGSYFDSIFACTIQKLNKCTICKKITEKPIHCTKETEYYSGVKWIKNDIINLLAILVGTIVAGLMVFLL